MKLTFGRVMAWIIATLFVFFVVVYIIDKIEDKRYRESCPRGINEGAFRVTVMDSSQVVRAKVFALYKHTGKIADSAVITHSSSGYYYLDKELNTRYNWKIKLNDGHDILISDIKTDLVEYWTSFGPTYRCEIKEWKIDGKQYNLEEYSF